MVKLNLFYRDGDNYKCQWSVEVKESVVTDLIDESESIEDYLDKEFKSDNLFEIENLGLNMSDIPLIKEFGESTMDHNYISITKLERVA